VTFEAVLIEMRSGAVRLVLDATGRRSLVADDPRHQALVGLIELALDDHAVLAAMEAGEPVRGRGIEAAPAPEGEDLDRARASAERSFGYEPVGSVYEVRSAGTATRHFVAWRELWNWVGVVEELEAEWAEASRRRRSCWLASRGSSARWTWPSTRTTRSWPRSRRRPPPPTT